MSLEYNLIKVTKGTMNGLWLLHSLDVNTVVWLPYPDNNNYLYLNKADSNRIPRLELAVTSVEALGAENATDCQLTMDHVLDVNHWQRTKCHVTIDSTKGVGLWLPVANMVASELQKLRRLRYDVK